jgi:hypothetical protein
MRSPASDSRSGRISGIPPATAASKRRSTPAVAAASNSSAPQLASSSLLAVTTGLPAFNAERIRVRAGSTPPITSTTMSTSGLDATEAASVVNLPVSIGTSRSRDWLRTAIDATDRFRPVRAAMRSASSTRRWHSAPPTLPQPSSPTRSGDDMGGRVVV